MAKRRDRRGLEELLAQAKDEVTKPAGDVVAQLYQALLALPELTLADGTTAKVEAYYPPQSDDEGRLHCGIDVRLANGNLLEFTLKNTGWEKAFAAQAAEEKRQPRQR